MTVITEFPSAAAKARFVRMSPTKVRRIIDLVRGKSVEDALNILRWAPQAASEPVAKVIASAAANAQNNNGLDPATLVIATAYADEGPTAKRIRPRAQGRAYRIRKRTSHITVIVESRPDRGAGRSGSASSVRSRRAQASKAASTSEATAGSAPGGKAAATKTAAKKAPAKKAPAKKAAAKKTAAQATAESSDTAGSAKNKVSSETASAATLSSEEAKGGSQ